MKPNPFSLFEVKDSFWQRAVEVKFQQNSMNNEEWENILNIVCKHFRSVCFNF